ncbi:MULTISPECIES: hypothetical protein [unclassified Acinetobacter]|uniref:hypothetical protein n=1 Tax=unclassified Acinetobacter TaxID=196816 RepID=UPI0015D255E7|nr:MULTISPECIES: hypothetical protein [unclassified Acinetobacter]
MKKAIVIFVLCLGVSFGVLADTKGVSIKTSGFDGVKEVSLKPYGTSSCLSLKQTCISVGAMWKSDVGELVGLNLLALRDMVIMSELLLNIDGKIIKAARINEAGGINTVGMYKESTQRFAITKQDFESLLQAKNVWLKINRTDGSYIETYLVSDGKDTLAFKGLHRFSKHLD